MILKLTVNEKTKWYKIAPLLSEENSKELQKKVAGQFQFDFYKLTIGEFAELQRGIPPREIKKKILKKNVTLFEVIRLRNAVEKFTKDFANILNSFEIPLTPKERAKLETLPKFELIEGMLIFCCKFFNLKNFGEAEKITLLEYWMAKKYNYVEQMINRSV